MIGLDHNASLYLYARIRIIVEFVSITLRVPNRCRHHCKYTHFQYEKVELVGTCKSHDHTTHDDDDVDDDGLSMFDIILLIDLSGIVASLRPQLSALTE